VAAFTALTIEGDPQTGQPRTVILNRDDGRTEHYVITDHSGAALGPDIRHYALGSRLVSDRVPEVTPGG